jgi:hypothetical protein
MFSALAISGIWLSVGVYALGGSALVPLIGLFLAVFATGMILDNNLN